MFNIVLYQPEIPPNTGNIIRLCANTGCQLHLIYPLGFVVNDKHLRRAGLDYAQWTEIKHYANYDEFLIAFTEQFEKGRIFACTTKAEKYYTDMKYQRNDVFLFGPETRGLPLSLLETFNNNQKIRIPMQSTSRSLNLSNAAAIIVYEAWRQQSFGLYA